MPTYHFDLVTPRTIIRDQEGTELTDEAAARAHARLVSLELMQNSDRATRVWRLSVTDGDRMLLFDLLFATVDMRLDHLDPGLRDGIEKLCTTTSKLGDTMRKIELTALSLEAKRQRKAGRPYLAACNGVAIDIGTPVQVTTFVEHAITGQPTHGTIRREHPFAVEGRDTHVHPFQRAPLGSG